MDTNSTIKLLTLERVFVVIVLEARFDTDRHFGLSWAQTCKTLHIDCSSGRAATMMKLT